MAVLRMHVSKLLFILFVIGFIANNVNGDCSRPVFTNPYGIQIYPDQDTYTDFYYIEMNCTRGLENNGLPPYSYCQEDGAWKQDDPTGGLCLKAQCIVSEVVDSDINVTTTETGGPYQTTIDNYDDVYFSCATLGRLEGAETGTCYNGTFDYDGATPECSAYCPVNLEELGEGLYYDIADPPVINETNTLYYENGKEITYRCSDGYEGPQNLTLSDDGTSTCKDGSWDPPEIPTCMDIDECSDNPCLNNATCNDLIDGYQCKCADGFNGTNCDNNIDDCANHTCQNGATCVDDIDSYKCQCPDGFSGIHCENEMTTAEMVTTMELPTSMETTAKASTTEGLPTSLPNSTPPSTPMTPTDSSTTSVVTPGLTTVTPDARTITPDSTTVGSGLTTVTPDATTTTPDSTTVGSGLTTVTPDARTITPDSTTVGSGLTTVTPDARTITPDLTTVGSGLTTFTPDARSITPDLTTVGSGLTTVTPDARTTTPDSTTVGSGLTTVTPDARTITPDSTTVGSGLTTVTPDVRTITPDLTTVGSGLTTVTPDARTITPGLTTVGSGLTTVTPDAMTVTPAISTETAPPTVPESTTKSDSTTSSNPTSLLPETTETVSVRSTSPGDPTEPSPTESQETTASRKTSPRTPERTEKPPTTQLPCGGECIATQECNTAENKCDCRPDYYEDEEDPENPCKEPESIDVTIKITNAEYNVELANPSSQEFEELESDVCRPFDEIYKNDTEYKDCRVLEFSSGSIIVNYVLTFAENSTQNASTVNTTVQQELQNPNGSFAGNYTFDDSSLVVAPLDECNKKIDDCDAENATCTDQGADGYTCECREGFEDVGIPKLLPGRECMESVPTEPQPTEPQPTEALPTVPRITKEPAEPGLEPWKVVVGVTVPIISILTITIVGLTCWQYRRQNRTSPKSAPTKMKTFPYDDDDTRGSSDRGATRPDSMMIMNNDGTVQEVVLPWRNIPAEEEFIFAPDNGKGRTQMLPMVDYPSDYAGSASYDNDPLGNIVGSFDNYTYQPHDMTNSTEIDSKYF